MLRKKSVLAWGSSTFKRPIGMLRWCSRVLWTNSWTRTTTCSRGTSFWTSWVFSSTKIKRCLITPQKSLLLSSLWQRSKVSTRGSSNRPACSKTKLPGSCHPMVWSMWWKWYWSRATRKCKRKSRTSSTLHWKQWINPGRKKCVAVRLYRQSSTTPRTQGSYL